MLEGYCRVSLEPFVLWLHILSFHSYSSWERPSSPPIPFMVLIWTHSSRSTYFLCQWPQRWTVLQMDVTRAEQGGQSLYLLATPLLMQPRLWLAFWAASTHCLVILSLSPGLVLIQSLPSLCLCFGMPQSRCRSL